MALLALGVVIEIIVWITAIYIMDGGIVREIGAIGLYATNIGIIATKQFYVSDLTSAPQYATLFLQGNLLIGWVLVNVILLFVCIGFFFQTIVMMQGKTIKEMIEADLLV